MRKRLSYMRPSLCSFMAAAMLMLLTECGTHRLTQADAAFNRGEYALAAEKYRKVIPAMKDGTPLKAQAALRLATAYLRLRTPSRAAGAYRLANRQPQSDTTLLLLMAQAYIDAGRENDALAACDTYLKQHPDDEQALKLQRKIEETSRLKPTRYVVRQAKEFNSRRADFSAAIPLKDPDRIYFTSSSQKAAGMISEVTGTKRCDIFTSRRDENGRWTRPEPVEGDLNSADDEGTPSISPDGNTMYLTIGRRRTDADMRLQIYTSRRRDAAWSEPQPFIIDSDTTANYVHPAVSPDGRWLFFASDRRGGYGGYDIWRLPLGQHQSPPQNLGPQVNTPGNEVFPTVRSDSVFYFSSDTLTGFGGLDIFRAKKAIAEGRWDVVNMGKPVNSHADDFAMIFTESERGYLSSNRGDARGYDDIYAFELPDISIGITGRVIDKDEEPVARALIRIVGDNGEMRSERSRDDGTFHFPLERGATYTMQVSAPGYLNMKQEFTTDDKEEDAEYEVEFILVATTKPQVAENIFYDFDRADLRPESRPALDEMIAILNEHPYITIEMSAHTDRKGTEAYNDALSLRRAKSVVDYLVAAGIDPARLSAKGYGKSRPKTITPRLHRLYPQFAEGTMLTPQFIETLSEEDREAADQINRRTEFTIISTNFEMD